MSTSILEHRIALPLAEQPFAKGEIHKAIGLLHRLHRLQYLAEHDRASSFTEGERAALLWALRNLGVICGRLIAPRVGADLRCVRPDDHGGDCDGYLRTDR